ncbi:MAG TPA: AlkA N-terminal domain-containing protein [Candidatus Limnocylindrales bacterium]|nr:AlkA N-terminal domain-containing protein [Candidatus Limnocylindrales bacterium]
MDLYPVISSKDRRFDGRFWVGVTTTGIYCRPSCPARTPKPENVRFFPSVAAAAKAGFRACRRCAPDAVPGSPQWDARADLTARAVRLINDGVVDRGGVPALAARLGYTERHLHRLLTQELGAGPIALARTQRAQTAKTLIAKTSLGLAEIAFASGFGSVRQFNDTFKEVYGCAPSALRRNSNDTVDGTINLKLAYRPPLNAKALFDFLGARAIPGIESYQDGVYQRSVRLPHGAATVALTPGDGHIAAQLNLSDVRDLTPAVARCRRLLDLDADPQAIDACVSGSQGTRVPRAVDGFEMAVRAVVGQQISVSGARTVLAKLVRDGLFPTPAELLELPDEAFAMPARRRETLRALAGAMLEGLTLDSGSDRETTRAALLSLPGIGEWTAGYISMRALGDPDVFLPTDLGSLHGAAALGLPTDPRELAKHAEQWRPWRSYAQILLWRAN